MIGSLLRHLPRLHRRLSDETGTTLVEILMAAALVGVIAVGVTTTMDVSARVSGTQKAKAVAGNIAESELERIRGLSATQITALNGTAVPRTEGGVTYTIRSTAGWAANAQGDDLGCGSQSGTSYLKLSVSVSWNGSDTPVTLDSIVAPGARNVIRTVGALAIRVKDNNGAGVSGLLVTLSAYGQSNRTGTTDSNGCVVWTSIPAATWSVSSQRSGYITPLGNTQITDEVSVAGQTFVSKEYEYAPGGTISGDFVTTKNGNANTPTAPQAFVVAHSAMRYGPSEQSYRVVTIPAGQTTFTTPALYPHTGYVIWAGSCSDQPAGAGTFVTADVGQTGQRIRLPALNVRTLDGGSAEAGTAKITICGQTLTRDTGSDGYLADPGFPYTSGGATVCGQVTTKDPGDPFWVGQSAHSNTLTGQSNTNMGAGTNMDFDAVWTRRCNGLPLLFGICFGITTYTLPSGWSTSGC